MTGPPARRTKEIELAAEKRALETVIDWNSLADSVHSDAGVPTDKRFRIVMSMLRETFAAARTNLRWGNTHTMLADGSPSLP